MNLCVDCNLLFAELEKHDFCPGFSAVIYGVFDKCQVDYWHRGDFVCCIKSEGMIATSVFFVIGNELRVTHSGAGAGGKCGICAWTDAGKPAGGYHVPVYQWRH